MGRRAKPLKGKADAKRTLSGKSPKNDGSKVRDLENRLAQSLEREKAKDHALTEALEQQAATSEILRVISRAQTDVQPVFDAIVRNAVRLCGALQGGVYRFDGELVHSVAHDGFTPEQLAQWRTTWPRRVTGGSVACEAIRTRKLVRIPDIETPSALAGLTPETLANLRARGSRSVMVVPMFRQNEVIGAIGLAHRDVDAFSATHVDLLTTFADQAVIAIENVRLFKELQEKNQALTQAHAQVSEALEQQTATSEILQVISSSPNDVQPVFDSIVASATRLCRGLFSAVYRYDGELIHLVAHHDFSPTALEAARRRFPMPPSRGGAVARAVLSRDVVHIPDLRLDAEYAYQALAHDLGFPSILAVPMLREGIPIGAIAVAGAEAVPFADKQITLLKTFADQAVIAIENVRLFTELQEKNRSLTEAHARVTESLEQQTATSEILRTIAHAQADVQPVFDTIVQSATRLCHATNAAVFLTDGLMVYPPVSANYGGPREALLATRALYPRPVDMDTPAGIAILTRSISQTPDTESSAIEQQRQVGRALGFRSSVTVPMLREGEPVGAIAVTRREPGPFSDSELELLKTFADQAVIAIENVRLFKELEARTQDLTRSVGELRALGEVGQAISSTLDLQTVLSTIVARATQLSSTDAGVIYEYDEQREVFVPRATAHLEAEIVETMLATPVRKGEGATGQLAQLHEPIQLPDILLAPAESRVRGALVQAGYRALLAVPLLRENHLLGGLTVIRKAPGEFAPEASCCGRLRRSPR